LHVPYCDLPGDHNLKVLRQECYISQQKRFINYLVNQLAAHQFLKIACQIEGRAKMSSAYSLLKAAAMELQGYFSVVDGRLVLLSDVIFLFESTFCWLASYYYPLCVHSYKI
jgi:hypothetical protein